VRTVEIDDEAHRELQEPTNRAALATLVTNAVEGDALVVVLDVKLSAPPGFPEGTDDYRRREDNEKLLAAIHAAARNGVPVVLPTWLKRDGEGSFSRVPNIFADSALPLPESDGTCATAASVDDAPVVRASASAAAAVEEAKVVRAPACARIGNVNLPVDRRKIPLTTPIGPDGRSESLALAAVSAYEQATHLGPRTVDEPAIASSGSQSSHSLTRSHRTVFSAAAASW
jgi:hypothetical protein